MAENKEVETTGHQWDDDEGYPLKEFNNPLPKWWLYTFVATIIWSLGYWVFYPAWPLIGEHGFTQGVLKWSMHKQLAEEMAEAKAFQQQFNDQLAATPLEEITHDPRLYEYAKSGGKAVFGDNCAPCHGSAGTGAKGFPSLVDDDWLYGGDIATIHETINYGRGGLMPAHLEAAGGMFSEAQVNDLAEYVLSLSGSGSDAMAVNRGKELFHGDGACYTCHGDNGKGSLKDQAFGEPLDHSVGAPNLTDGVWLYGGDRETVVQTIAYGRNGKMPAWGEGWEGLGRKLDPLAVKQVAVYVQSLSGAR